MPESAATSLHAALAGRPAVYAAWAMRVTLLLAIAVVALSVTLWRTATTREVRIVRIDDLGRAEALTYDAAAWTPQLPELRYFLTRFVVLHYSRLRGSVARDYPQSLYFLRPELAARLTTRGQDPVQAFLTTPGAYEVEVTVRNVTFSTLDAVPYQAAVDFITTERHATSGAIGKTTTQTAQVTFQIRRDAIPASFIPVNPLGFEILQLRVDEAFD